MKKQTEIHQEKADSENIFNILKDEVDSEDKCSLKNAEQLQVGKS